MRRNDSYERQREIERAAEKLTQRFHLATEKWAEAKKRADARLKKAADDARSNAREENGLVLVAGTWISRREVETIQGRKSQHVAPSMDRRWPFPGCDDWGHPWREFGGEIAGVCCFVTLRSGREVEFPDLDADLVATLLGEA